MTLTREDAWHKYRHGNSPLVDSSEMEPFLAGWSARDAEVERLRAACEAAKNLDKLGFLMASDNEEEAASATVRASQIKGQLIIALAGEVTK